MTAPPAAARPALALPALLRLACGYAIATSGTILMPVIVTALMHRFGVSEGAATGVAGLEVAGIALACAVLPRWIRSAAAAYAWIGALGTLAAQAAGTWAPTLAAVGATRALTGFFEGMLFVVGAAALSRRAQAERAWGVIVLVGGVIDAVLLTGASSLPPAWTDTWLFALFAAVFALFTAPALAGARHAHDGSAAGLAPAPRHPIGVLLPIWAVMALVYGVLAAQWAVASVVGDRIGLAPATTGLLLSLASIVGLCGCLAASHPRSHLLRLPIVRAAQALLALSAAWFFVAQGASTYFAAQGLVTLAFYAITPFLTARLSELDADGSLVARSVVVTFASVAAGTAAAGALLAGLGSRGCGLALAACAIASLPFARRALAPHPASVGEPPAAPAPEAS